MSAERRFNHVGYSFAGGDFEERGGVGDGEDAGWGWMKTRLKLGDVAGAAAIVETAAGE